MYLIATIDMFHNILSFISLLNILCPVIILITFELGFRKLKLIGVNVSILLYSFVNTTV